MAIAQNFMFGPIVGGVSSMLLSKLTNLTESFLETLRRSFNKKLIILSKINRCRMFIFTWCQFHQRVYVQLLLAQILTTQKAVWVDCLFALLGSACVKAAHKMLMKLTPGEKVEQTLMGGGEFSSKKVIISLQYICFDILFCSKFWFLDVF